MTGDYNQWHDDHDQDDDISTPWHRFVQEKITKDDVTNKKLLDIGCGRGGFSNYLANDTSSQQIFACDYSAVALDIARRKYGNGGGAITWQKENIMSLTFEDNYFHTVISCETIEHVPDSYSAIKELYRVLKPGGKLLLTCPNYFNLFGIWCFYRWIIGKPFTEGGQPYVNYILMPRIYRWLKKVGFHIEEYNSSEIIIPAKVPRHFWNQNTPRWLSPFGYRTYYTARK